MERRPRRLGAPVNLTFISLLDVEKFGSRSVLGAFVVLLVGMKNDGECSVAFPYLGLGCGAWQVEYGAVSNGERENGRLWSGTD